MPDIQVQLGELENSAVVLVQVSTGGDAAPLAGTGPERAGVGIGERARSAASAVAGQIEIVAAETFRESLGVIPQLGDVVLNKVKSMKEAPREVEVTMAFKIGAKGNIKMVEANGEAHLQVTLRWNTNPETG